MNMSATNKTIQPGTVVYKLSPVREIVAGHNSEGVVNNILNMPKHLEWLFDCSTNYLENQDMDRAKHLLIRYSDLFFETDEDIGRTALVQHKIDTGNQSAFKQVPRRLPFHKQNEVDEHITDMLKMGITEPFKRSWSSAIVLLQKKDGYIL